MKRRRTHNLPKKNISLLSQGPIIHLYLCVGKSTNILPCFHIFLVRVFFNLKLTSFYFVFTAIPRGRPFPWSSDKHERKKFWKNRFILNFHFTFDFLSLVASCPQQLEHLRLVHLLSNLTAIHNESETHT